jgi:hypothetical protein
MLLNLEEIDIKKIIIHDPYNLNDNIIKMDLSINKLEPLMIKLDELNVININENDNILILDLREKDNIKGFFNKLDEYIVSVLHDRKIAKKLKLKFSYKQLTTTYTGKDNTFDLLCLNINLNNDEYTTDVYKSNKIKLDKSETLNLLKDNCHTEIILELVSVTIDKEKELIYIENIIRQMKVKKIKPKRIHKLEYSFVDTESESESVEVEIEIEVKNKTKTDDDRLINNSENSEKSNIHELNNSETSEDDDKYLHSDCDE